MTMGAEYRLVKRDKSGRIIKNCRIFRDPPILEVLEETAQNTARRIFAYIELQSWFNNDFNDDIEISKPDWGLIKQKFTSR